MLPSSNLAPKTSSPTKLERVACVAVGAILLLPVLRRRSWLRYAAAASGGALIYNGISGGVSIADHLILQKTSLPLTIRKSITIGRNAAALSDMWRNPEVIARIMQPFGEAEVLGTDHLRWTFHAAGKKVQIESTLTENRPGELVRWRSVPSTGLMLDEQIRFKPAPQDRGTEATLVYEVDFSALPAGATLRGLTSFFAGAAHIAVGKILHNFKSFAETGEIPTLQRNPSARANSKPDGDLI